MTLIDDDQTSLQQGSFCTSCGEATGTGRFCAKCGTAVPMRMSTPAGSTLNGNSTVPSTTSTTTMPAGGSTPPPSPVSPQQRSGGPGRGALIALGALGLAAAAIAVVVLTTTHSSSSLKHRSAAAVAPSVGAAYEAKLRVALSPMVSANHRLSNVLGSVNPSQTDVVPAKNAAAAAQTALATTRGAAGALTAPSSAQTVTEQVQQALDNESGYVQAVTATLNNPNSSQASQLQTLATSLQSSLVPLDQLASGASASVSGTSSLTSWANGATARARHRARAAQHSSSASTSTASSANSGSPSGASTAASSDPYTNGQACGGGLYAGPNTSCPFAANVQQAYNQAPGLDATVQVFSPVTNQTYSMSCSPAGSGVTCSGANNASVAW
jgi:hypothetical protein